MDSINTPIVKLRDVRFTYDGGATWALDGVSLDIRRGERICLTGPNGSGKTTLSRVIAGLTAPDEGHVTLLGNAVFDDAGAHAQAYRAARRGIGAVFQNPEDQIVTTVTEDDVAFGPENLAVAHDEIGKRIAGSLDAVDMGDSRASDPTRMSGGQQQRVAIAGMLAMNSEVLVLDEPTAMLDPSGRADIMRVLDELQERGTTVILVTHHEDELDHADRVIQLESGHIVGDGPAGESLRLPIRSVGLPKRVLEPRGETIIDVKDLSYRHAGAEHDVFDHLSFSIGKGETVALMGHNGAGKTTLARLLCALTKPKSGSIAIDGIAVSATKRNGTVKTLSRRNRAKLRRTVGYVMQHPERQLFDETVAEDVAYGPSNQGLEASEAADRAMQAMRLLHIEHLRDSSPFDLSGGQQRLVAIAGVIACEPKVLVLDEPTAGLDEEAIARVHGLIHELKSRGMTMLVISHSQEEVNEIADRTIILGESTAVPSTGSAAMGTESSTGQDRMDDGTRDAVERRTWLERLDPRVGMLSALALMFSAFAIGSFWQLLLAVILIGAVVVTGRIDVGRLIASVHVFLAMFVFCGLLNVFFVRTGNVVTNIGPIPITDDGMRIAVLYACRFAVVIVIGAIFLDSTTPTAMTDAFESLLSPFARLGMHAQETALVMSLALRFLPTLGMEAKSVIDAQAARGGGIETGSFANRVKALAAIVVPVFAGAIRHADNLSLALDARCYEEGMARTHWRVMRMRRGDVIACCVVIAYLVVLTALGALM